MYKDLLYIVYMTNQEKRERFQRLANYRTNIVLKSLKVLGNCANRSAYEYTETEMQKIFKEIESSVKNTKAKFYYTKNKKFKL